MVSITHTYASRDEAALACIKRFTQSATIACGIKLDELRSCKSDVAKRCLASIIHIEHAQLSKQHLMTTPGDYAKALKIPLKTINRTWKEAEKWQGK